MFRWGLAVTLTLMAAPAAPQTPNANPCFQIMASISASSRELGPVLLNACTGETWRLAQRNYADVTIWEWQRLERRDRNPAIEVDGGRAPGVAALLSLADEARYHEWREEQVRRGAPVQPAPTIPELRRMYPGPDLSPALGKLPADHVFPPDRIRPR